MTTINQMTLAECEQRIKDINAEVETRFATIQATIDRVQDAGRDLNDAENAAMRAETTTLTGLRAELEQVEHRSRELQISERGRQIHDAIAQATGRRPDPRGHSPLLVSETHLRSHAEAIRNGSVYGAVEELREVETRAIVTVASDMGSPAAWGASTVPAPKTLRQFSGVPNIPLTGATASMPSLTLPAGAAGVAESTAHGEFDAVAPVELAALRYGRWSEVTSFVDAFDSIDPLNRAHAVGIARDLNLADVTAIQTAAGSVTAFDANNLDRNVRTAILQVAEAALVDVEDVVLFGTAAALAVVTGCSPASGGDRGSVSVRVLGARVYVTAAATAGNVYAFAPSGFQVFSSRLRSASVIDPTTGAPKFGQWLHSTPAGVGVVGAAAGVDVVTP
jgi:hypothetical protein